MSSYARTHARRATALQAHSRTAGPRGPSLLERFALPLVVAATLAALIAVVVLARGGDAAGGPGFLAAGEPAPDFSALDVVSGETMTLADLEGTRTLLFFSEGAACQACMVQINDLQGSKELDQEGVRLVSVSTDPPDVLASAAKQYGITTPLLSDSSREMSRDYDMLGKGGMGHAQTDGHAFMLLEANGRIAWEHAYNQMYVPTEELIDEIRSGGSGSSEMGEGMRH